MTRTVPRRCDIRVRARALAWPGLAIVHEPVAVGHGSGFATAAPSGGAGACRVNGYSQPRSSAVRRASVRLRVPVLAMAEEK
ncbi:hypothetical protein ACIQWA_34855 [Kitasatospora sp. NPDC098652]|uniref:hypothetical protein n=1 Tax=Kitasatospora sp. NPDC098652 TaxID=3364095 RepID=UPI0037FA1562